MTFLFTRAFSKCQYLRGVFTGRCGADELDLKMKPELMCVDESTNSSQLITSPSPPYRSSSSLPPPPPFHSQSLTVGILLLSKPRDICLSPRAFLRSNLAIGAAAAWSLSGWNSADGFCLSFTPSEKTRVWSAFQRQNKAAVKTESDFTWGAVMQRRFRRAWIKFKVIFWGLKLL